VSAVYALLVPGYADWELAFALPEIRKSGRFEVVTVGLALEPVTSMGGVRALPELLWRDVDASDAALLLLPGSERWEQPIDGAVLELLRGWRAPLGAICGATIALAEAGLLDRRRHTSNLPGYLERHAPGYRGQAHYVAELCVADDGVVTASGAGPVEFARELLRLLSIYREPELSSWYALFKHGVVP
jgi:putative intracellular protease/amidase